MLTATIKNPNQSFLSIDFDSSIFSKELINSLCALDLSRISKVELEILSSKVQAMVLPTSAVARLKADSSLDAIWDSAIQDLENDEEIGKDIKEARMRTLAEKSIMLEQAKNDFINKATTERSESDVNASLVPFGLETVVNGTKTTYRLQGQDVLSVVTTGLKSADASTFDKIFGAIRLVWDSVSVVSSLFGLTLCGFNSSSNAAGKLAAIFSKAKDLLNIFINLLKPVIDTAKTLLQRFNALINALRFLQKMGSLLSIIKAILSSLRWWEYVLGVAQLLAYVATLIVTDGAGVVYSVICLTASLTNLTADTVRYISIL